METNTENAEHSEGSNEQHEFFIDPGHRYSAFHCHSQIINHVTLVSGLAAMVPTCMWKVEVRPKRHLRKANTFEKPTPSAIMFIFSNIPLSSALPKEY